MKVESFVNIIGADFYAGVPDSQLKSPLRLSRKYLWN